MVITNLNLFTRQLFQQTEFYQNTLGFSLTDKTGDSASFKIGHSTLTFSQSDSATPYHFAINIPSNKDVEALYWLKQRTTVLKDGDDELIDFQSWNAKAMYFYDSDSNIVELISRKNLKNEVDEPFQQNHFIGISEIGLSVQNIALTYKAINDIKEVSIYDGSLNRFCAAGDEQGLLIIIDQNQKGWFPNNEFAYSSDFELTGDISFDFINGKIKEKRTGYASTGGHTNPKTN